MRAFMITVLLLDCTASHRAARSYDGFASPTSHWGSVVSRELPRSPSQQPNSVLRRDLVWRWLADACLSVGPKEVFSFPQGRFVGRVPWQHRARRFAPAILPSCNVQGTAFVAATTAIEIIGMPVLLWWHARFDRD